MTTVNAINKLQKAGFKVGNHESFYTAQRENEVIDFIDQKGKAICIRGRSANDQDDPQTDYSAGVFYESLTQAINRSFSN